MFSPRWNKVLRDLWRNKRRTLLVVLSVAVGVFSVGAVWHMQVIASRDMVSSYYATNPASAVIHTADSFDQDLLQVIRRIPDVAEAEGRRSIVVRFQHDPEKGWYSLRLFAIPDYEDMRINIIGPENDFDYPDWTAPVPMPPPDRELLLERTSFALANLGLVKAKLGDSLLIETPSGRQREMRIAGLVYDFSRPPATNVLMGYGYVTFDTLEWLGEPSGFNELHILVKGDRQDVEHVTQVAGEVRDRVERSGITVVRTEIPTPGELPVEYQFRTIVLILGELGILSLVLSGFLVVNTISALLSQQIRQIGMMKAVGARTHQIVGMYVSMVLILAVLSLLIAMPLAAWAAYVMVNFMSIFINFKLTEFNIPPQVLVVEATMGLLVPILAALYPILSNARTTVREVISNYGIDQEQFGSSSLDRLLERVHGLPSHLLLSLRNALRRKRQFLMTLTTLTLASTVFISVVSIRTSMDLTLENLMDYVKYDVQVQFGRPYRTLKLEQETLSVPGVVRVESWGTANAYRLRPDDSESGNIFIFAPPAETDLMEPSVVQGRWLLPEDMNAIVVSTGMLEEEPDLRVGSELALKIEGYETTWRIVGVIQIPQPVPVAYVNYPYLARTVRSVGLASVVNVVTRQHDEAFQAQVAEALEEHLESAGLNVNSVTTLAWQRTFTEAFFSIVITFLMIMAIMLAVVGGLGLMGAVSINVLERTREIGVMRAIGASDDIVLQIFVVEGIVIGICSWFLGTIIAIPLGKFLSDSVGRQLLHVSFDYTVPVGGILLWLALVVILAAVASYVPALSAVKLGVRDALSYE